MEPVTIMGRDPVVVPNQFYTSVIDPELMHYEIKPSKIRLGEILGKGHFGVVKEGWYRPTPDSDEVMVAVKIINPEASREGDDEFLEEAKIMLDMDHEHILRCYGLCAQPRVWLVMEFCEGGNLLTFLEACKHQMEGGVVLSVLEVVNMMEDIVKGMVYLDQQHKVHRDLAARNILIANDPTSPMRKLKIADFGLTRDNYTTEYVMDLTARDKALPVRWVAPESMIEGVFNSKSDVWSYGVVCWELGSLGDLPYGSFRGTREIIDEVKRGLKIQRPPYYTDEMYRIMQSAMHYRPERRANFSQLLTMIQQYKLSIRDAMHLDNFMMQRYTHNPMAPAEYFTAEETGEAEYNEAAGVTRAESLRRSLRTAQTALRSSLRGRNQSNDEAIPLTNLQRETRLSSKRRQEETGRNQYVGDIAGVQDDYDLKKEGAGANAGLKVNMGVDSVTASQDTYNVPRPNPESEQSNASVFSANGSVQAAGTAVGARQGRLQSEVPTNYNWPSSEPAQNAASAQYSDPRPAGGSSTTGASIASTGSQRGQLQSEVPVNYNWPSSNPAPGPGTYSDPRPAASSAVSGASVTSNTSAASQHGQLQSEVPVNYNWPSSNPAPSAARRTTGPAATQATYQHPNPQAQQQQPPRSGAGRLESTASVDVHPVPWMTQEELEQARPQPSPRQPSPRHGTASGSSARPRPSPRTARSGPAAREPSLEETAAVNSNYSNKYLSQSTKKKKPPPPQRKETLDKDQPVQLTGMRRIGSSSGADTNGGVAAAQPHPSTYTGEEFEITL